MVFQQNKHGKQEWKDLISGCECNRRAIRISCKSGSDPLVLLNAIQSSVLILHQKLRFKGKIAKGDLEQTKEVSSQAELISNYGLGKETLLH